MNHDGKGFKALQLQNLGEMERSMLDDYAWEFIDHEPAPILSLDCRSPDSS